MSIEERGGSSTKSSGTSSNAEVKISNVQQDEVYDDVVDENDCECVFDDVEVTTMISHMEVDDDVDEDDDDFECVHNVDYNETIWMIRCLCVCLFVLLACSVSQPC